MCQQYTIIIFQISIAVSITHITFMYEPNIRILFRTCVICQGNTIQLEIHICKENDIFFNIVYLKFF